jgi:hypothetical protein
MFDVLKITIPALAFQTNTQPTRFLILLAPHAHEARDVPRYRVLSLLIFLGYKAVFLICCVRGASHRAPFPLLPRF